MSARHLLTLSLAGMMVALGVVLVVESVIVGGSLGIVLGLLFAAAGSLRVWLLRKGAT
jgi:hypothetical protein